MCREAGLKRCGGEISSENDVIKAAFTLIFSNNVTISVTDRMQGRPVESSQRATETTPMMIDSSS